MNVRMIWRLSMALILCMPACTALASDPLFQETEVFVGGQDGINTYRIPAVVCTRKGTVLVFAEGRKDNDQDGSPTHLVSKRSLGNSGAWQLRLPHSPGPASIGRSKAHNLTWEPMQVILASKGTEAFMNPVPIIDESTGEIFLLINRYLHFGKAEDAGRGDVQTLLLRSSDEGASWSEPIDLTPSVGRIALGPGIGIETRHGALVAPTYAGVIFSDDHGKTWQAGGEIGGPPNEAQVAELTDGSWLFNLRGSPNRTVFISKDDGRTWGAPWKDPALTDSELWGGCQASLVRYTRKDDGYTQNRLLFANPADPKYRFDLTVRLSYDEGKTWPISKLIRKGPGAYSSLTAFPDGTIGLVYETGGSRDGIVEYDERLDFVRFNLEWLTDGKDHLTRTAGR